MIPLNNALGWLGVAVTVLSCWWVWMVQQDLDTLSATNAELSATNALQARIIDERLDYLAQVRTAAFHRDLDDMLRDALDRGSVAAEELLRARSDE